MNETTTGAQPRAGARTAVPPPAVPAALAPPAEQGPPRLGRVLARAAAVTAVLTIAGSLLGLVRDQSIAHLFGAGPDSDAFLISWTVPEMASTLLIEDAMALVLVPAFSHALARRAAGTTRTPYAPWSPARCPGCSSCSGAPPGRWCWVRRWSWTYWRPVSPIPDWPWNAPG